MRSTAALALTLALAASPAAAQIRIMRGPGSTGAEMLLDNAPAGYGVGGWRVGQWVRYSISENVGAPMPISRMRTMQVVGRSGERFWIESSTEFSGGVSASSPVQKQLFAFGPTREVQGTESYTLSPSDSSVRHTTVVRGGTARRAAAFPEGWTRVGEESVSVAGGTFQSVHWRKGNEDLWTSADSGMIGVVKYSSNDMQIELAGKGDTGARSRIPFPGGN
jgi:hypothetical protein